MASAKQDLEINIPTAQMKKSNSEIKKEARLRIHKANIDWLNKEWKGPNWFPTDLLRPSKPCRSVVRGLKNITEEAMIKNIPLPSLWESGGYLRNVVDQDLATRKAGRNRKHKHPQSGRLTKKMVNHARKNMSSSKAEKGNDCISSPGSTTGDDSEVEAPEKSSAASRLSSSALDSSAKQRLPSALHDTIASMEDELRDPPQVTKRALEDDEDKTSNSTRNTSPQVTIDEVLGKLSSDRIETARRILDIELDTVLSVKRDAEQALMDMLHRDYSVAVTQAERVQARNRKQEADKAFRQTDERLHGPSQTLAAVSNLKKTFDARALRALKLENAERMVKTCKERLHKAHMNHEAALKSNPIDDCDLEAVWDMFKGDDADENDFQ
ncbi:uncharacterized protein FFB20_04121 [Fusarium fujikuroi]|nr:uncharacterized protein Y057_979 [Fusarium fujikuroi]SCN72153.1 uncharacterized protein FFB20_04121 [Fusarium fujikuroi]SCN88723.1 uncharacterized protein FFC1_05539 [Fusarium fujikuroi]